MTEIRKLLQLQYVSQCLNQLVQLIQKQLDEVSQQYVTFNHTQKLQQILVDIALGSAVMCLLVCNLGTVLNLELTAKMC